MSELKPCPFCGGVAQANTWTMHGITESRCFCPNPDCPNSVRTVALATWNNRPLEDALQARAEKAEAMIGKLIDVGNDLYSADQPNYRLAAWDALVAEWKSECSK